MDEGVSLVRVRSLHNPFWAEGPLPVLTSGRLTEIIDEFEPDIIHTHENVIMSTQLLRLKDDLDIPLLASCYSLPVFVTNYLPQSELLREWAHERMWHYLVNNLNQYDFVVFSTEAHREPFLQHGFNAPSRVISNGVDTMRFRPQDGQPDQLVWRYRLPPKPRILFVGRLARDKKIDVLIESMEQITKRRPAHLLIVGRGNERENLEALVDDLGLHQWVHFLGYVPEADLPGIYQASDLFTMVSICEVQNIPLLQALVTGLPAVVADAAALPEVVHDGVNGYLVPPDDPEATAEAILRILEQPERSDGFGQVSIAIGLKHAEENTFRAYSDLYRQMLASGPVETAKQIVSADGV